MDGSRKLRSGFSAPSPTTGRPADRVQGLVLAVAEWMRYIGGIDERGAPIDVRRPLAGGCAR